MIRLHAQKLTAKAYAPFGEVLSAEVPTDANATPNSPADRTIRLVNFGYALRLDNLCQFVNARPLAKLNICAFRCKPRSESPLVLSALEKHPESTQVFVPMNATRYLVVVALGHDAPDLATAAAFLAGPREGISYHPGVWHHPLFALDAETDFMCVVAEDGGAGDCVLANLPSASALHVFV